MRQTFVAIVLLLCSSMSAQMRFDLGVAGGQQTYEAGPDSRFMLSAEAMLSRGRVALYYALDHADMDPSGSMYANHFGLAYRWPVGENLAIRGGAGPSHVSIEQLGGELAWHAQVELAPRTGRFEWFARLRHFDYTLEEFRVADESPGGPAMLAGVRMTLWQ